MKCLLCPIEIDELKEFPATRGPQGQVIEDIMGRWNHSQALNQWVHVALTAQKPGGSMSILSGHICPAHPIQPGSVALMAAPETTAPRVVVAGTPPIPALKTEAIHTQTAPVIQKGKEK
jgi:hypothetical protein